ncbi:glycoside hydrolase family 3 N-terminal domain-containing protein [Arthrobacter sp. M4]|uniref:glycoside hydrolase family 3 N-terminal domain-containing protein n=1 Tax=Arthrobacter sp. M4 TaxID=218160 RepID=UPI001CDC67B8|nr:glycoside hydrolase family 3 N-terminal domain-containing protein [Arthrobacter sp. M4]MCA4132581.1 hypothetical protein [Arthrobacter sp. M4]
MASPSGRDYVGWASRHHAVVQLGRGNGEPVSASTRLLKTLLREQTGFEGLLVSDYGAVGNLHIVQRVAQSGPHAGLRHSM